MNERLVALYPTLAAADWEFICECGDTACTKGIVLSAPEYQAVRGYPTRFAVAPGHQIERDERVVSTSEQFTVVEKPVSLG